MLDQTTATDSDYGPGHIARLEQTEIITRPDGRMSREVDAGTAEVLKLFDIGEFGKGLVAQAYSAELEGSLLAEIAIADKDAKNRILAMREIRRRAIENARLNGYMTKQTRTAERTVDGVTARIIAQEVAIARTKPSAAEEFLRQLPRDEPRPVVAADVPAEGEPNEPRSDALAGTDEPAGDADQCAAPGWQLVRDGADDPAQPDAGPGDGPDGGSASNENAGPYRAGHDPAADPWRGSPFGTFGGTADTDRH